MAERGGNFSDICPGADCPYRSGPPISQDCRHSPPTSGRAGAADDDSAPTDQRMRPAFQAAATNRMLLHCGSQPSQRTGAKNWSASTTTSATRFAPPSATSTIPGKPLQPSRCGPTRPAFPTIQTAFKGPGVSLVARLTATASPTLLNEFVFSYTADHIILNDTGNWQRPGGFSTGFTICFRAMARGVLPGINVDRSGGVYGNFGEDRGLHSQRDLQLQPDLHLPRQREQRSWASTICNLAPTSPRPRRMSLAASWRMARTPAI